ncbi:MAG: hypothetical protein NZM42_14380, partial [Gemmatales bacterium]|nr:hypothetical protein [Gemmatales bacterium]
SDPWIFGDLCFRWWAVETLPTFAMFLDLRSAARERNLMFDKDVHALLEVLPSPLRNNTNLGARVIKRLCPSAGRVLNSNSLLPACWPPIAHQLSKTCKPVLGRMRRLIYGNTHHTTGAWPNKSALYTTDRMWRLYIKEALLSDQLVASKLFDQDEVRKCFKALEAGHDRVAADVEKLIQLSSVIGWLKLNADTMSC